MLAVAVHEQDGAEPRMIEAGEQGRLLAEIARQGDHLDVDAVGRQARARSSSVCIAAAVIDIDDLAGEVSIWRAGRRQCDETAHAAPQGRRPR